MTPSSLKEKLRPCPFCASTVVLDTEDVFICSGCGANISLYEPDLIEAWNRRSDDAELRARLSAVDMELAAWEKAADATDIVDYLRDALARMGTVGPRGIREMVAQYSKLQSALSAMKRERDELAHDIERHLEILASKERELEKAVKALEPFAKEAKARANLAPGPDIYDWPIGGSALTLGDICRAQEVHTELLKEAGGNP